MGLAQFLLCQVWRRKLTDSDLTTAITEPLHSVLVVEDDPEQRESLCAMLDLEGFPHAEASNGREALDYLKESRAPCLVLLDLEMPVMNGRDFRASQLADERLAQIPVVIVTANDKGLEKHFPGVEGFLWKPLEFEKLAVVLDRCCTRREHMLPRITPAVA